MTEERDHPASPEQPGAGGFEETERKSPDDERSGESSEGNETPPDEHEGKFSDTEEADDR